MRVSDADREQVIDVLKGAFVQGRLVKDELDARAGRAFASRTYAELAAVTADIPPDPDRFQMPREEPARPQAEPPVPQAVISWAFGIIAAEFFLLLAVFAFPVYGTLGLAVLANTLGLPLAGGLMLDAWRASRPREEERRGQRPDEQRPPGQRSPGQRPRRPCSAAAQSAHTKAARSAMSSIAALCAANAMAAADRSTPMPNAAGNSDNAASSRQPVPVPRSSARLGGVRSANAARAASIRVSDSGRGISVAAETANSRLQNSRLPTISASGSRASRRVSNGSRAVGST